MKIPALLILLAGLLPGLALGQAPSRAPAAPASSAVPALPPLPSQAGPQVPSSSNGEYRLGPGDVVRITVYGQNDLNMEAELSADGSINFPLVGNLMLGGLSKPEAERTIAERLSSGGFVQRPHVNLLVTQYLSRHISVMGEVNRPGKYSISRRVHLTDVLALAGGVSPRGGDMVTVIKKEPDGTSSRRQVDVKTLLGSADMSKDVLLDSGDIVYVAPMAVFYIYGEVRQPGAYPLANEMNVRQALSLGGGLTPRASERGIKVDRRGPDGSVRTYQARLTDKLQPNDVVQVPESLF
jgi:polysaccharide export outer membrane protein